MKNKPKIIVLGCGMVGSAIAIELSKKYSVSCADINKKALDKLASKNKIDTIPSDLGNTEVIKKIISPFDLVIGAVPGFLGFQMMKTVIEAKKNIVDISFFPEDPFLLDTLARKNKVIAATDCGVAPGMSNIIAGHHNRKMKISSFLCLVGGLPVTRHFPYEYKAPFSPIDVVEEYTRPARYIENGKTVIREALSDPEFIEFDEIGTLEAFNTDGLRTLVKTMPHIPDMKEKTMRYPKHIEYIKVLRETGFFDKTPININGTEIRPIDFTSKLLFPKWKLKEHEEEFTAMKVIVAGKENQTEVKYTYSLFDRYDKKTNTSSMARTTGYTCCAVAEMVLSGMYEKKGINPPEFIGQNEKCFEFILNYLKQRNVIYKMFRVADSKGEATRNQ